MKGLVYFSISSLRASLIFFFSSRRRHTRFDCDWSSDVCSSDLSQAGVVDRRAMAGMGPDDAKREHRALALDEERKRAANITEANESDPQNSSFSIMELRFDSSAA